MAFRLFRNVCEFSSHFISISASSQIHDFARAYGSLCWNLSKVIPRKDLPRIFTMCLPVAEVEGETPPAGLADLHQTRNDVVREVMKAPKTSSGQCHYAFV